MKLWTNSKIERETRERDTREREERKEDQYRRRGRLLLDLSSGAHYGLVAHAAQGDISGHAAHVPDTRDDVSGVGAALEAGSEKMNSDRERERETLADRNSCLVCSARLLSSLFCRDFNLLSV